MSAPTDFSQFRIVRLTAPIFHTFEFELQAFAAHGLPVTVVDADTPEGIIARVRDPDIVTPDRNLPHHAHCRVHDTLPRHSARMGAGTDRIDVAHATKLGIVVANTPFFCVEEQADHAMAMLFESGAQADDVPERHGLGRTDPHAAPWAAGSRPARQPWGWWALGAAQSIWHAAPRALMRAGDAQEQECIDRRSRCTRCDDDGSGYHPGRIGLRVAPFAPQFGYLSPHRRGGAGQDEANCDLDGCPLSGKLVDEIALIDALDHGRFAGAGIDTTACLMC